MCPVHTGRPTHGEGSAVSPRALSRQVGRPMACTTRGSADRVSAARQGTGRRTAWYLVLLVRRKCSGSAGMVPQPFLRCCCPPVWLMVTPSLDHPESAAGTGREDMIPSTCGMASPSSVRGTAWKDTVHLPGWRGDSYSVASSRDGINTVPAEAAGTVPSADSVQSTLGRPTHWSVKPGVGRPVQPGHAGHLRWHNINAVP